MTEPIEVRCAVCQATGEAHLNAARAESRAGRAQGNPVVAEHLMLAEMWRDIGRLHDEGAAP